MKIFNFRRLALLMCLAVVILIYQFGRGFWYPMYSKVAGKKTVAEVVQAYGDASRERLAPFFEKAGISYPPQEIALLAVKDARVLEVWARAQGSWTFVKTYDVQAASGIAGPKLREGDRQVPEGIYQISGLNPNSAYHLSMKLNYPNTFDLKWANAEGRHQPGTNIFIHGKAVSVGCLAMGDPAIEELFVLVQDVGRNDVRVIIAPTDPRVSPLVPGEGSQAWVSELYRDVTRAFIDVTSG